MALTTPRENIRPRYERLRWQVFAVTWLAYAGFYLTRKSFSIAKVELAKPDVMGLSLGDMAWIDGAYLTAYAVGQFTWGMAGDRFGTRRVILIGMMASILVGVAMGVSTFVLVLAVLFGVQGLCQATGWAPLTKCIANFFSQHERGRVMGLWCTNYAIGGLLASWLAGWAAVEYGWRAAFFVPAGVLFVIWLLFLMFQKNRPEDAGLPSIEAYHHEKEAVLDDNDNDAMAGVEEPADGSWHVIRQVLSDRMILLLGAVYFFLKPTRYLVLFSAPLYLSQRLGTDALDSGVLGSMFELAGPAGVLIGGWASDKVFKSRRVPMCVMALAALAVLLFFFDDIPATRTYLGLGLFGVGFLLFIPDSLVSGTAAIDFGTKQGASTAAGFINGCGSIGAIAGGTLPGWIGGLVGQGTYIWDDVFFWLSVTIAIAAVLLLPQWNRLPTTSSDDTA